MSESVQCDLSGHVILTVVPVRRPSPCKINQSKNCIRVLMTGVFISCVYHLNIFVLFFYLFKTLYWGNSKWAISSVVLTIAATEWQTREIASVTDSYQEAVIFGHVETASKYVFSYLFCIYLIYQSRACVILCQHVRIHLFCSMISWKKF